MFSPYLRIEKDFTWFQKNLVILAKIAALHVTMFVVGWWVGLNRSWFKMANQIEKTWLEYDKCKMQCAPPPPNQPHP